MTVRATRSSPIKTFRILETRTPFSRIASQIDRRLISGQADHTNISTVDVYGLVSCVLSRRNSTSSSRHSSKLLMIFSASVKKISRLAFSSRHVVWPSTHFCNSVRSRSIVDSSASDLTCDASSRLRKSGSRSRIERAVSISDLWISLVVFRLLKSHVANPAENAPINKSRAGTARVSMPLGV